MTAAATFSRPSKSTLEKLIQINLKEYFSHFEYDPEIGQSTRRQQARGSANVEFSMSSQFNVLEAIINSEYADKMLASTAQIQSYAEAFGAHISATQAEHIAAIGKRWLEEQRCGDGQWSRMREEAREALGMSEVHKAEPDQGGTS